MKLYKIWFWESLENLPLLLGFVLAARLWRTNVLVGLAVLALSVGTGVLITRLVEPKLHKDYRAVTWLSTIANFLLFVALAIPLIYYFSPETPWTSWKTDILGGFLVGLILTLVQSLHWRGLMARMLVHGGAMLAAFPLIMLGLRSVLNIDNWGLLIASTILLALFASLVIAMIDYQEMYRKEN